MTAGLAEWKAESILVLRMGRRQNGVMHVKKKGSWACLLLRMALIVLPVTPAAGEPLSLDIGDGDIIVTDNVVEQGGSSQSMAADGLRITGTSQTHTVTVKSAGGGTSVPLVLDNLTLSNESGKSLIDIQSGSATITLSGSSTLTGGGATQVDEQYVGNALVRVPEGAELPLKGDGALTLNNGTADNGAHGAAIGGSAEEDAGSIRILSGNVTIEH